ncbi:hypothetical protein Cgig2_010206 [Carnegiea gigantea]|uniref:Uncharacterized protein n=1 Tax=Carnegiea gigantea TaxID=171969 RepID=A0A9Q1GXM0_9CARY|nr:hypothetical protein Cgig2_010206 [Carnegiea gigantea]
MTDTIMQQVTEHVNKAMEAANSARPLPTFDYAPATAVSRPTGASHRRSDEPREIAHLEKDGRPWDEDCDRSIAIDALNRRPSVGRPTKYTTASMPYATDSRRTACILMEVKEHPMLRRPQPMTAASKPHNAQKYCKFHEQNGHTIAECRELRKALHELANKG